MTSKFVGQLAGGLRRQHKLYSKCLNTNLSFTPCRRLQTTNISRTSVSSVAPVTIKLPKPISALRYKPRPTGKQRRSDTPGKDEWSVVGYSSSESIDLLGLQEGLEKQLIYSRVPLSSDLEPHCLYVTNRYNLEHQEKSKEIYFFKIGCVVFWNVPELERNAVLRFLKDYNEDNYDEDVVFEESEMMTYCMSKTNNSHLEKGVINIDSDSPALVKYTFSNAIAASVKLGTWEAGLDKIIDSIEHVSDDLKKRADVRISKHEVLQKTGEVILDISNNRSVE